MRTKRVLAAIVALVLAAAASGCTTETGIRADIALWAGEKVAFFKGASIYYSDSKTNICWLIGKFAGGTVWSMVEAKYRVEDANRYSAEIVGRVNMNLDEQVPDCRGQPTF